MWVWQFDAQYALPSGPSGQPYYWTNCYHWLQSSDTTPDAAVISQFASIARQAIPSYLVYVGGRAVSPSHIDTFIPFPVFVPGSGPWAGMPGPLHNVVRVEFLAAGQLAGYKRLRGCWQPAQIAGGVFTDDVVSFLQGSWAALALANPLCSSSGVAFDAVRVRREVFGWQVRHGTKRAARPVWVMP